MNSSTLSGSAQPTAVPPQSNPSRNGQHGIVEDLMSAEWGEQHILRLSPTGDTLSQSEVLAEQQGELDADTRWALAWFEQNRFNEGPYGVAQTLCTAKNTSAQGIKNAGIGFVAVGGNAGLVSRCHIHCSCVFEGSAAISGHSTGPASAIRRG